jgi:hypothetical protein
VDVAAFVERLRVSKAQVRHTSWVPANAACHDAPPGFALPCELAAVLARAGAMPLYRRAHLRGGCVRGASHAAHAACAAAAGARLTRRQPRASTALLCLRVASHQSSAIAAALAGRSVVVSTPTASGKSLWCAARSQHAHSTICTRSCRV